jgi:hypothetical protein
MIAEGDAIAVTWRWAATHLGDVPSFTATGKPLQMSGITVYDFDTADRLSGHWQIADRLGSISSCSRHRCPKARPIFEVWQAPPSLPMPRRAADAGDRQRQRPHSYGTACLTTCCFRHWRGRRPQRYRQVSRYRRIEKPLATCWRERFEMFSRTSAKISRYRPSPHPQRR